jgi:nardilysin
MKRNGSHARAARNKVQKMIKPTVLTAPVQSKSDKKNYRLIRLENGLHALLIHHDSWDEATKDENKSKFVSESDQSAISDETCEEGEEEEEEEEEDDRQKLAAVALNIGVGSFQDPEDIQGLAHFVEHMIFMGSEKYPKENELDQYLSANGGASNAHTECEYTLFHLDIVEDFLAGAVDRFASLFVSPLMLRDSMSREIEAVESEFQNNINNDDCRLEQMWASKANGVAGTFTWGNSKTLKEEVDPDKLYDAAHEFRKKYYVANNMWLCIESAESLDSLQCLVEKHFTGIKSGNTEKQIRTAPATDHFKAEFYDKLFYVKPKGDKCKIYLTFVFPSLESHYKTKPHDFLAFIIQHDGVGSLSSYLKRK